MLALVAGIQPRCVRTVTDFFQPGGVSRAVDTALLDTRHEGGYEGRG